MCHVLKRIMPDDHEQKVTSIFLESTRCACVLFVLSALLLCFNTGFGNRLLLCFDTDFSFIAALLRNKEQLLTEWSHTLRILDIPLQAPHCIITVLQFCL